MTDSLSAAEAGPPRCPLCGRVGLLALVEPSGAALCARCGEVFLWINEHLARELRRKKEMIRLTTELRKLGLDSLDVVEVVMDLEEEYGVSVPDDVVQGWVTIADLVRWISEDRDADAA